MTTRLVTSGQRVWEGERDENGHRTYKILFLVQGAYTDGPANALQTPGLPVKGAMWKFDNDIDVWAWCRWNTSIRPVVKNEPNNFFELEFTFSTKPPDKNERPCKDSQVEDPLLEPQQMSGSTTKYQEEAQVDRFGNPVTNSAHEQIRGPQVEFDRHRSQVKVVQNVPQLQYAMVNSMVDTVSSTPMWGLPTRCVKLSEFTWDRKFHGSCEVYFVRNLTFDVSYLVDVHVTQYSLGYVIVTLPISKLRSGFDKYILDEGTKCLRGYWQTDPTSVQFGKYIVDNTLDPANPANFVRFKDFNGENARVILDGLGRPVDTSETGTGSGIAKPGNIFVSKYDESDFLGQLNVPADFAVV